jgi:hypothetical protein
MGGETKGQEWQEDHGIQNTAKALHCAQTVNDLDFFFCLVASTAFSCKEFFDLDSWRIDIIALYVL